ncbi:MAG: metabolite traffic protein EboE [Planctomycetales bacterium]|nr:metabolite traffic protein EboE [Planctomycetales bacterium]
MTTRARQVGYCTNVHAGADLATTKENLLRHACEVKRLAYPDQPMGIGLWLAAPAARDLVELDTIAPFAAWLAEAGLTPFTLNGFPYGDFHQDVVKHKVYQPTWVAEERESYTLDLIAILDGILPAGQSGSISTLPLCWGDPAPKADFLQAAAARLLSVARTCADLEKASGRLITICLEPEPGCALQTSHDMVRFFQNFLLNGPNAEIARRHLRVCHDVCHAAVMFEPQRDVLQRYRNAGIRVGKVQVSSAVCLDFSALDPSQRPAAVEQLSKFSEDRYLHQTVVRHDTGDTFFEDLPLALQAQGDSLSGEWRVHFHVPIYLESFGLLGTSRDDIIECLAATAADDGLTHFEVETYAWGVLPSELQQQTLAAGIAEEMRWFESVANAQARG